MTAPRDGDVALLGRLGLNNELTIWLLSKGRSSFLGMLPSEMARYQKRLAPACRAVVGLNRCGRPMVARGTSWVCYRHDPPVRLRDEPLKPLYAGGRIEDHLGDVVDVRYTREPGEVRASWKTKVSKF